MEKEKLSSRLGFILLSAGCAIGLGNVWRFPYITGEYGGAAFVVIYLLFLLVMGLPLVIAELAVGRGSNSSIGQSFDVLGTKHTFWRYYKYPAYAGNIILMMFYTVVSGWILLYLFKTIKGDFAGLTPAQVGGMFGNMLTDYPTMIFCTFIIIVLSFGVCYLGVRNGVERITKIMMSGLFILVLVLVIKSCSLPNAAEGLKYYLLPDFARLANAGFGKALGAAMSQAFFTLGLGVGSLGIFGAYTDKQRSLTGEALLILSLDTVVAIMAGLIIFPACSSFGVDQAAGPVLVFITLPNIFNNMSGGQFWGALFFLFMVFASVSTVISVFENIVAITREMFNLERRKTIKIMCIIMCILSLPCIFGFNLWAGFEPLGKGTCVLDLEDFILSYNILPIGTMIYILFCTLETGWGWNNFIREVNIGVGVKMSASVRFYLTYGLPLIILTIFINGYINLFWK